MFGGMKLQAALDPLSVEAVGGAAYFKPVTYCDVYTSFVTSS